MQSLTVVDSKQMLQENITKINSLSKKLKVKIILILLIKKKQKTRQTRARNFFDLYIVFTDIFNCFAFLLNKFFSLDKLN